MDLVALSAALACTIVLVVFPKVSCLNDMPTQGEQQLLGFFVPRSRRALAIITETTDEPPRFEAVRERNALSGKCRILCACSDSRIIGCVGHFCRRGTDGQSG